MNSVGLGAFFNLCNFGQMYSYHVLLLPIAVVALVVAHVLYASTASCRRLSCARWPRGRQRPPTSHQSRPRPAVA